MTRLRLKAIEGLLFGTLGRVFLTALQIFTSLATARYLAPREFGIVAFALVYINFLSQFSDFGITSAVVQKGRPGQRTLHSAFTLKAIIGVMLSCVGIVIGIVVALAGQVASGIIIALLSTNFFVTSFSFLPNTKLTVDLNYRALFNVTVTSAVVNSSVTVLLLACGLSYWSVAIAYICSSLTAALHLNYIRPSSRRLRWDRTGFVALLSFGWPIFFTGLINFAVLYGGNLIIGLFLGPDDLGLYALALTFSFMLVNHVGSVLVSVMFPIYSQVHLDKAEVRSMFMKSVQYTAMFCVLVNVGLICVAKPFLVVVLSGGSDKWLPALHALQILCCGGILAALLYPIAPLTVAIGKPQLQLRAVVLAALVQIIGVVPALNLAGIEGVALVFSLSWVAQYFVYLPILRREFDLTYVALAGAVAPAAIAGAAMLVFSLYIENVLPQPVTYPPSFGTLSLQIVMLASLFVAIHSGLTKGRILGELLDLSRSAIAARRRL